VIFPITHEDMSARRWPAATIAIIALCVVCFIVLLSAMNRSRSDTLTTATRLLGYWEEHPYLQLRPPCDRIVAAARPPARRVPAPDADQRAVEQTYVDGLCEDLQHVIEASPVRRFAFVPGGGSWLGLLTHQFLHGSWPHLLFNMWFLWLCGCNLEDKWGRLVFVPFYLSAGIAGGLAHKLAAPDSLVPMIGASGAIAGAMGAFLISFARTRIRFFYWLFLVRAGTFTAPAFVMLPLWIAQEVAVGLLSAGDGVAHWAHVGGFAYGVAFALLLRLTGLEARLDDAVERKVSTMQDPRIMRAAELTTAGRPGDALALLEALTGQRPDDVDAHLELLRAAQAARDARAEARAYARLVGLYLDLGHVDTACDLLLEAQQTGRDTALPVELRLRLGDRLVGAGKGDKAWLAYGSITREGLADTSAVRAALAQAKLAVRLGRALDARALLDAVLESPFSTPGMDEAARAELEGLERGYRA
jgi:membrane associated rhomboid family serine protease